MTATSAGSIQAQLSKHDLQIILGYARGHTTARIARALGTTEAAIKSRTHRLAKNLGIVGARQAALVHYAYAHGHLVVTRSRTARPLPRRAREVLSCAARGLGRRATASELGISPETVAMHRKRIFLTLDVHTTPRAIAVAWEAGLLGPARSTKPSSPFPQKGATS